MNWGMLQFSQVTKQIIESWASAVQLQLTAMEYREHGVLNYAANNQANTSIQRLQFGYQYWNRNIDTEYTSLFIDLTDDFNQNFVNYNLGLLNSIGIYDNVSGYTLAGIESSMLKHSYGLSSLAENLKNNKPAGVTDEEIDLLLLSF